MSKDENNSLNILKIIIKHTGLGVTDALFNGAASKLYDTYKDIRDYTKKCNEALYTQQLEVFLTTMDVTQQEFEEFFRTNPDNLRLGLETIKILEQTILEKQAEMLAIAFQLYIKDPTPDNKKIFHKNVHIINNIDEYLISEIENLKNYPVSPPTPRVRIGQRVDLSRYVINPHKDLINFGFLKPPKVGINSAGSEY
ncbi:TPA: hypothetical protein OV749_003532, partial [Acinetobacter baumannii]|nr:hypothetical protein [Acinetobacter baumannii]